MFECSLIICTSILISLLIISILLYLDSRQMTNNKTNSPCGSAQSPYCEQLNKELKSVKRKLRILIGILMVLTSLGFFIR